MHPKSGLGTKVLLVTASLMGLVAAVAWAGTPVENEYNRLGGAQGSLGPSTTLELPSVGGSYQEYRNGSIFYSPRSGGEVRTRCPGWACGGPAKRVCQGIRQATKPNAGLSDFERATGEIGTFLKTHHVLSKGWASRGCFLHNAVGRLVRNPQWSNDNIWTLDLRVDEYDYKGKHYRDSFKGRPFYLRLEVWPQGKHGNSGYAWREVDRRAAQGSKFACVPFPNCHSFKKKLLRGANIPRLTPIHFGGLVVDDRDHGIDEVHPDREFVVG